MREQRALKPQKIERPKWKEVKFLTWKTESEWIYYRQFTDYYCRQTLSTCNRCHFFTRQNKEWMRGSQCLLMIRQYFILGGKNVMEPDQILSTVVSYITNRGQREHELTWVKDAHLCPRPLHPVNKRCTPVPSVPNMLKKLRKQNQNQRGPTKGIMWKTYTNAFRI
jgi:hypothetical protein